MKKLTLALTLVMTSMLAGPAFAKDPCKTVICMFGKLKGQGGDSSECSDAVSDYFSIVVKKKGKIKASKTSDKRMEFLDQCSFEDEGKKKQINNKFGKVF